MTYIRNPCRLRFSVSPCAGQTGKLKGMKESDGEGIASHAGPESCVTARKGEGEALTGVRAGRVLSREIGDPVQLIGQSRVPTPWRKAEGKTRCAARARQAGTLRGRETPDTHGINLHGNREILGSSAVEGTADRIVKPKGKRR